MVTEIVTVYKNAKIIIIHDMKIQILIYYTVISVSIAIDIFPQKHVALSV